MTIVGRVNVQGTTYTAPKLLFEDLVDEVVGDRAIASDENDRSLQWCPQSHSKELVGDGSGFLTREIT